jgi:hypothetical protein
VQLNEQKEQLNEQKVQLDEQKNLLDEQKAQLALQDELLRKSVKTLSLAGLSHEAIASNLGLDKKDVIRLMA